ncbi:MAG TPA: cytochrome C oxidase subunit IV family protein [Pyrinomonadaceae bacterium]
MSSRLVDRVKDLSKKEDVILNLISFALAVGFIIFAIANISMAGTFLSIDSLFIMAVSLMMALIFLVSPLMWLHANGMLKMPGAGGEGVAPKADLVPVHFEGTTRLFLSILGWLLGLTLVEVFLAYIHVPLHIMLTILIGLSLIKAALIVAYFMHLRFERLSLVLTLIPMLVVCVCLLLVFFPDSFRSSALRYRFNGGGSATAVEGGH